MTEEQPVTTEAETRQPSVARGVSSHWRTATVVLAALVVLVGSGWALTLARSSGTPSQSGPEVGFARDMFVHHEQAVTMSFLVMTRTDDPEVTQFAMDVAQSQATQQGRMLAWLEDSGVGAPTDEYQPMAWMTTPDVSGGGHGEEHPTAEAPPEGTDPTMAGMGMATDAQLIELGRLEGRDAEVLYLQLMYRHHVGGLEMAEALLERSDEPALSHLAESVITSQDREIAIMSELLTERGAKIPDA